MADNALNQGFNAAATDKPAPGELTAALWRDPPMTEIEDLLQRGADVNEKDEQGFASLQIAAGVRRTDLMRLLIEKGADVNAPGCAALPDAAAVGKLQAVKLLLEKGADVNQANGGNPTALGAAAIAGHADIVEFLLQIGADVNKGRGANQSVTPLMTAAAAGHEDIVRLLLANNADIEIKTGTGRDALLMAKEKGREGIISLLEHEMERRRQAAQDSARHAGTVQAQGILKARLKKAGATHG